MLVWGDVGGTGITEIKRNAFPPVAGSVPELTRSVRVSGSVTWTTRLHSGESLMAQEVTLDHQTKSSDALSPAPVAEDRLLVGIAGYTAVD